MTSMDPTTTHTIDADDANEDGSLADTLGSDSLPEDGMGTGETERPGD